MQSLHTQETDVFLADNLANDLEQLIEPFKNEKIFVLTDKNTHRHCFPLISRIEGISEERCIITDPGDEYKNTETLISVWQKLVEGGANRHALLINLGGGMPCDLGGFAAATFKRGIAFINIPTTLLAQVDASVGGKTGINFMGYKNEIGSFMQAKHVLVDTTLLKTLDQPNLISGFAEMIKHAYLKNEPLLKRTLNFDILNPDMQELSKLVAESIKIKDEVVTADPFEKNIRKALNLGHTIGHAFESFALKNNQPVLHGYAVAWGMVAELYLAHIKLGFPLKMVEELTAYTKNIFGSFSYTKADFDYLYETMTHDKKNQAGRINFTLLKAVGDIAINTHCEVHEVHEALSFYLEN
ncbi:3-dehydroquinate synthase [Natronoflexus pectinivorans]|uniref:3-dehydroquinate synthase n=1 Tax=Natronoflexus pectinivorans TaxID=682526 RepID=A0A4R2GIJ3_9BACT|nr:3-dehydroquinate synthase [Natronoflexus pectinivorans]TCO08030.1 3-dehydroquinate synthase [Natronoflexus pectinivorans]